MRQTGLICKGRHNTERRFDPLRLTVGEGVLGTHRVPLISSPVVHVDHPIPPRGADAELGGDGCFNIPRDLRDRRLEVHLILQKQEESRGGIGKNGVP